ncbi:conserved hypothetical protein [Talaromyces stipitatus ATCC 10500]|uniref:Transcription factor domain-containing protein n=1 Tax=Talaromyces stipitatus (strain ATCC 10500 / CBS 375.48 / QM 6759 / NRRL 1006) TaxID=441959 RepID=B8MG22_TALSN|nr:uncharacterized protein TSTA_010070 [Talaromyces stipitatus ATCC 10500]EED15889.1 conserved hypothetical protein [Talaromyces stipitatus ATCC 10500]
MSKHVHTDGFKSVEIIQGYYISLLSATPANYLGEERLWLYTNYAFSIAAELGLDHRARQRNTRNVHDTTSVMCQRMARNRERNWLQILLWECANSAACGRITTLPETELTQNIENWWLHPLADSTNRSTCAFTLFRREMAALDADLRTQAVLPHPNHPHWIAERVDLALDSWVERWISFPLATTSDTTIAPPPLEAEFPAVYLYYVYLHGRLLTLCYALYYVSKNNNTEHDLNAIREDCFEAAVKVCEIAVQDLQKMGDSLYCMLAPTWAMISYAAVLALQLFPLLHGARPGNDVELLSLLGLVTLHLERAGSTPPHRFGIATLLGQHLKIILRTRASNLVDLAPHSENKNFPSLDTQRQAYNEPLAGTAGLADMQSYDDFWTSFDPFFASTTVLPEMESNGEPFANVF